MGIEGFGLRMRAARKRKRLTQESVCEKLDLSKAAISHWEHGKNYPEFLAFVGFVDLTGADAHELLFGETRKPALPDDIDEETLAMARRLKFVKAHRPQRFEAIQTLVSEPVDDEKIPPQFRNPAAARETKG